MSFSDHWKSREDARFINLKVKLAVDEFFGARGGMRCNWDCNEHLVEMVCVYLICNFHFSHSVQII